MHANTHLWLVTPLAVLVAAVGCASSNTSTPSTTPTAPAKEVAPAPVAVAEPRAELALADPGAPKLEPIYFDTDRAVLRADTRATLQRYAKLIERHPEWGTVTIDGHCDERGAEEYNFALGERRASTVARYLTDLGVPTERLATRSYGEARPAVVGNDESAWSQNRRTELLSEARDSARR